MNRLSRLGIVLTVLSFATAAHGQAVTANLQGVATDPSGAVMADVAIKAANLATGEQRTTQTNSEGFYRFNLLPRGRYEVRAQKAGFSDQTVNVTLTVGDTITANFALKLPGRVEQVEVTSLPTEVDTATSQIEQPGFGRPSDIISPPRQLQLGVRVIF